MTLCKILYVRHYVSQKYNWALFTKYWLLSLITFPTTALQVTFSVFALKVITWVSLNNNLTEKLSLLLIWTEIELFLHFKRLFLVVSTVWHWVSASHEMVLGCYLVSMYIICKMLSKILCKVLRVILRYYVRSYSTRKAQI